MAFNPQKLQFLLEQLSSSERNSFSGIVSQIFSYLDDQVKDNQIFEKFEKERKIWENWPPKDGDYVMHDWTLPNTIELTKSLAYDIYRTIASEGSRFAENFSFELFNEGSVSENISQLNRTFLGYFIEALNDIANANPEVDIEKPKKIDGDVVFIIHGHDNELKNEVLLLLKRAGVNAIVLHEQADKGRTIIDKLIEESNNAGYAVALLTPDDLTENGNTRARQNVILEIGYFIGIVGKERLRMVVKSNIEIPSDLGGILYEKYDAQGAWKIKLLKEIQAVGIYVDIAAVIESF